MAKAKVFYVALGSNIGDRKKYLLEARKAIAALPGTECIAETAVEETAPLGPIAQPHYLNQMLAVKTRLAPQALLEELQLIEESAGRKRGARWGPRTLDLDVVAMEGETVNSRSLIVPHPELPNRDFWIRELEFLRRTVIRDG
ncbi:MAG: 2-amino-4-hydroxy-6-hydroxymethyldihydropteridine diphosphokinase [Gemmatimonadaceae bacterium]|nr:2-amino-4-hydroxy-6-hydroxymethyldihydropteridine diphosphokinase [Gemmatimonadaceae bacterium]